MIYAVVALLGLATGMSLHWLSLPLIGSILGAALGLAGAHYQVKLAWVLTDAICMLITLDIAFFVGAAIWFADWRYFLKRQP